MRSPSFLKETSFTHVTALLVYFSWKCAECKTGVMRQHLSFTLKPDMSQKSNSAFEEQCCFCLLAACEINHSASVLIKKIILEGINTFLKTSMCV